MGAGSICGGIMVSDTIAGCSGSGNPKLGPPNENPKLISLVLRVLCSGLAKASVLWSRGGGARTQLRAGAFVAAPRAL